MSILINVKNALALIIHGEWREFLFRLRIHLGQIDLKSSNHDELQLHEDRSYHYADSAGLHLDEVLKNLHITPQDAIVDFGSGKGGVLFTFSKHPFAKITGCELSPELAAIAEKNLKAMKIKNVTLVVTDAADFTDLAEYNYFYFFNPFPCTVMQEVIKNIMASLSKHSRKITIIYCNPECHDVVVTNTPFIKTKEYCHHGLTYYIYTNGS